MSGPAPTIPEPRPVPHYLPLAAVFAIAGLASSPARFARSMSTLRRRVLRTGNQDFRVGAWAGDGVASARRTKARKPRTR